MENVQGGLKIAIILCLLATLLFVVPGQSQPPAVSYPVETGSSATLDGSHIWLSNFSGTVTKLRVGDGVIAGVFPLDTQGTGRLLFDGAHIWAMVKSSTELAKIRPSDGAVLGRFPAPGYPSIASDGVHLWLAASYQAQLVKMRIADGAVVGTYTSGLESRRLLFDGKHILVYGDDPQTGGAALSKIRPSDGAILITYQTNKSAFQLGDMAYDGTFVWFLVDHELCKMDTETGVTLLCFAVGDLSSSITVSQNHVWVANAFGHGANRYRLSDGRFNGYFDTSYPVGGIAQLVFDGNGIWALPYGPAKFVFKAPNVDFTSVAISSVPEMLALSVDAQPITGGKIFHWPIGSTHTLSAAALQGSGTTRYIFESWSDSGQATHTISVPELNTNYTANFRTQHRLSTSAFPPGAGTIHASPVATDGFYDGETIVQLIPVPVAGARFQSWSGDATGNANPLSVTMSAPRNITANFVPTSPCTFTLASTSVAIPASGGASAVNVTPSNAACTFTASSPVEWVSVTTSTSSTAYIVQPNPTPTARNATLTIAGNSFTIQQAAADCGVSLSQSVASVPAAGATLTIDVTATSNNCTWTSSSPASWATITAGATGAGNGTVTVQVLANSSGLPRGINLLIAGYGFNITQSAVSAAGLRFVPVTPCRLLETRSEYNYEGRTGAFGPPYLKAGETRTLIPANSTVCSIPTTARAFVLNITLIPRSGVDFVTLFPGGAPRPDFFSIRSPDGQTVANQAIVASGNGALQIYTTHDTDMLLDISGYFADAQPAGTNLVFYPLTPCRVIETRAAYRTPAGPFGPPTMSKGETRRFRFPASPHCVIPPGAAAYSATLTAVPPQPLPYMTAWAAGGAQPNVSSINSFAGRTLANNVIIPANGSGEIDVYAFDRTDFLVDINGYFASDNGQGLYYTPVSQCRASDAEYAKDQTRSIAVPTGGNCTGIAATAKGYVINATAIPNGTPMPFLTLYPTGQPRPNASVLNAFEGQTVTNTSIIPAGTNGAIDVYAFERTRVVVDVSGYFSR